MRAAALARAAAACRRGGPTLRGVLYSCRPPRRRGVRTHAPASSASDAPHAGQPPPPAADPASPTGEPLRTFAATLAYDGTDLAGFQVQLRPPGVREPPTVQGSLEAALAALAGGGWADPSSPRRLRPPRPLPAARAALTVQGAGRTDAGVHARGQVVSFRAPARLAAGVGRPAKGLGAALNALLPPAIRVRRVAPAPPDFSARFSCLDKTYVYYIAAGVGGDDWEEEPPGADPLLPRFAAVVRGRLDAEAMAAAAAALVGTHDFSGFATAHGGSGRGRGRDADDGVRTLSEARVVEVGLGGGAPAWPPPPPLLVGGAAAWAAPAPARATRRPPPQLLACVFTGDGFLYRQARHMAAALMAVGSGRLPARAVGAAVEAGGAGAAARAAGAARGWTVAPPAGLFLQAATYPPFPADVDAPMHADVPHDAWGRVDTAALRARSAAREGGGVGRREALAEVAAVRRARAAAAGRGGQDRVTL